MIRKWLNILLGDKYFIKQNRLSMVNSLLFGIAFIGMIVYYITLM